MRVTSECFFHRGHATANEFKVAGHADGATVVEIVESNLEFGERSGPMGEVFVVVAKTLHKELDQFSHRATA
jgi:hypothetical protein